MTNDDNFFTDLIEAVKEEKILYCKNVPGYTDRHAKQKAWEKVAIKTGRTIDECEKRWHLLREKYGREIRKVDMASDSGASQNRSWPYLECMAFLKDCIKKRRKRRNESKSAKLSERKPSSSSSFEVSVDNTTFMSPSSFVQCNSIDDSSVMLETRKRKRIKAESWDTEVAEKFQEVMDAYKEKAAVEESEDDLFMKTIVKMMDPLPMSVKDKIKKQILDSVIFERRKVFDN